jgi:hypothetical protein
MPNVPTWSYPAIVACINGARAPTFGELKRVAKRTRRELALGAGERSKRKAARIALAALAGTAETSQA